MKYTSGAVSAPCVCTAHPLCRSAVLVFQPSCGGLAWDRAQCVVCVVGGREPPVSISFFCRHANVMGLRTSSLPISVGKDELMLHTHTQKDPP